MIEIPMGLISLIASILTYVGLGLCFICLGFTGYSICTDREVPIWMRTTALVLGLAFIGTLSGFITVV